MLSFFRIYKRIENKRTGRLSISRKLGRKQPQAYEAGQILECFPINRDRWDEDEDKRVLDATCKHRT
jgi:hypothetical protein